VGEGNDDGTCAVVSAKDGSERVTQIAIVRKRMMPLVTDSRFACAAARDELQLPGVGYRFSES